MLNSENHSADFQVNETRVSVNYENSDAYVVVSNGSRQDGTDNYFLVQSTDELNDLIYVLTEAKEWIEKQ